MKALILNSGVGSRMGILTQNRPKGMTEIGGGYTILSRQLEQLSRIGVHKAVITTGAFADTLRAYVDSLDPDMDIIYAHNPDFAETNYIMSMHLAAPLLEGRENVLFFHGDLVLEDSVYRDLFDSPYSAVTVDSGLPLPEKDFKARLRDGRVTAIGVELSGPDCVACQPAYKWLSADFAAWLYSVDAFIRRGETGVYGENALNVLTGSLHLHPLELHGRLCGEIDNPQDLAVLGARFMEDLAKQQDATDNDTKAVSE